MTAQSIINPLPNFMGLDGLPLTGGYVYIGAANQDPRAYPTSAFFDSDRTIVAAQPLRTQAGYVFRNGSPTNVWLEDGYHSVLVLDALGRQVFYAASWHGVIESPVVSTIAVDRFSGTGAQVSFTLSVTPTGENNTEVYVAGLYQQKNTYSVAGNVLTFAVAPASGTNNIEVNTLSQVDYAAIAASITASAANAATSAGSAAASLATLQASLTAAEIGGESVVNGLIGTESSAIAINSLAPPAYAMKVVDATNPANNKLGSIPSVLGSGVFTRPKMVMASDGRTLKWSPHNFAKQTNNPGANIVGATVIAAADSDGTLQAAKITATSTVQAAFKQIALPIGAYSGMYQTIEWIVEAGTAAFGLVGFNDGAYKLAYFNTTTWALGTVTAGLTATISATRANGTALPSNKRRVTVSFVNTGASIDLYCGMADADGSQNVTLGRTFIAEKPFVHFGLQVMDYFENTTTGLLVGVPYDYSMGGPRILVEPSYTYLSRYSDDMTNAAWVKSASMAAALTTTGPHNEPCSTLTSSAADQTCIQAVVSAASNQCFSAYVRRRTGTGPISITTNNGGTWTDITAQLNSTYYVRVSLGGVANPNFGFKISTSGDAIDVALALNASTSDLTSAWPMYGANVSPAADNLTVLSNMVTAGTAWTVYCDAERAASPTFEAFFLGPRIGKSDFTQETTFAVNQLNGEASMSVNDGSVTKTYPIYKLALGSANAVVDNRMEITAKIEANQHVMSVNGEPAAWITAAGMPTVQQVKIGMGNPTFLRRLLIVPRAVPRDDVRTWRYAAGVRNRVLDAKVVAWDSDPAVPNTTMNRGPALCVLSDDGAVADVLVFWAQKHDTGFTAEAPTRLMSRKYRLDKNAGSVTPLTAASVIQQQAGWASGTGTLGGPMCFRIPDGRPNAGRLVMLFTVLENPSFSPDKRSIYLMTNDGNGDPTRWSTATSVVAAASGQAFILEPSGSNVILPPTHPVAPNRLVCMLYVPGGSAQSIYSDDGGATWTRGAMFSPAITIDESNLALRPDGTVILTSRVNAAPVTRRTWAKSTDGGISFVDQGVLPAYSYVDCAAGLTQLDPTGTAGPYGRMAISHPASAANRFGVQIDFATDAAMTFGSSLKPWALNRYFGYSSLKALFGGTHMALAVEGGSVPFNIDNTSYLALIKAS